MSREKLTKEILFNYLSHKLKGVITNSLVDDFADADFVEDLSIFEKGQIWQYCGYADSDLSIPLGDGEINGFLVRKGFTYACFKNNFKPILRPMSYLEDYFDNLHGQLDHQDVTDFIDEDFLKYRGIDYVEDLEHIIPEHIPYGTLKVLLKHHFDFYGLIPKGLAVDMNTLL